MREEDAADNAAVPAEEAEIAAFSNEGSHILASHENLSSGSWQTMSQNTLWNQEIVSLETFMHGNKSGNLVFLA